MGCGKTTIGKRLAAKLDCDFLDLDDFLEKEAGLSISEIFAKSGEATFRALETTAIKVLCEREGRLVIATGGGALLSEENAAIAREKGRVFFLDVPFSVCYRRIVGDAHRPLAANSTRTALLQLYTHRRAIYRQNSHFAISVLTRTPPVVILEKILKNLV